jgi:hypothetical protein
MCGLLSIARMDPAEGAVPGRRFGGLASGISGLVRLAALASGGLGLGIRGGRREWSFGARRPKAGLGLRLDGRVRTTAGV